MSDDEIHHADILRSMDSVCDAWENDTEIDVEKMTHQLEEIIEVVKGNNDFSQFLKNTDLKYIKNS